MFNSNHNRHTINKICFVLVDGAWGLWSIWSDCSATCDSGLQERLRVCSEPLYGGQGCQGQAKETKKCNVHSCKGQSLHIVSYFSGSK